MCQCQSLLLTTLKKTTIAICTVHETPFTTGQTNIITYGMKSIIITCELPQHINSQQLTIDAGDITHLAASGAQVLAIHFQVRLLMNNLTQMLIHYFQSLQYVNSIFHLTSHH